MQAVLLGVPFSCAFAKLRKSDC